MRRNRNHIRLGIALAVFIFVFFFTSCSSLPVSAQGDEPVAARVNGEPIPLAALEKAATRRLEGIRAAGDPEPTDMTLFRQQVLDTLIQQMLIEQAALAQNLTVSDADLDTEITLMIEIAGGRENWLAQLEADRLTEEEFRALLRSALVTQQLRDVLTVNACVNVEQVRARHILVADETTANTLLAQLGAGADFVAVAAQYSLDVTTRQVGGDLGWFARGQLLQPAVENVAFGLAVNAISAPVLSELGYHIVQTLERAVDRPVDPETCYRLSEAVFEAWIADQTVRAQIERFI